MSARAKVRRLELIEEHPSAPRPPPGRPVAGGSALPIPAAPLPALKPEREEGGRIPPRVLRRVAEIRRRIRELEEEERRLLAPYTGA